jgi:hypothetical protein
MQVNSWFTYLSLKLLFHAFFRISAFPVKKIPKTLVNNSKLFQKRIVFILNLSFNKYLIFPIQTE